MRGGLLGLLGVIAITAIMIDVFAEIFKVLVHKNQIRKRFSSEWSRSQAESVIARLL